MKKVSLITIIGMLLMSQALSVSSDEVLSLRGSNDLDNTALAIEKKKQLKKTGGFDRAWELQPPTIPHDISKEKISLKGNSCMKCHSKENFKKEKAPEIGESHYTARDGSVLEKPSSRRWFCNQCHVSQTDAQPLVGNTF